MSNWARGSETGSDPEQVEVAVAVDIARRQDPADPAVVGGCLENPVDLSGEDRHRDRANRVHDESGPVVAGELAGGERESRAAGDDVIGVRGNAPLLAFMKTDTVPDP